MERYDEFIEAIQSTEISFESSVFKLVLSVILGGIIGIERKRKGQMAGVRTFALICMGSTLAMIISIYIPQVYFQLKNGDPSRIAAQVITGIGFLGAGAIIQNRGSIRGLTTAAGIWVAAAIGLGIGVGMYWLSLICTCLVLFVLVSMEHYEHKMMKERRAKIIRIECEELNIDILRIKEVLKKFQIVIQDVLMQNDVANRRKTIEFVVLAKSETDFQQLFDDLQQDPTITSISLKNALD